MTTQPLRAGHHMPALFPSGVVADRFQIVRVLGIGGTGTVFEAVDATNGQSVALKAIPRDERMQRRARREMRVAAALDHPAIVRLIDSVDDADYIYVIFELVRGDDLAHVFQEGLLDDAATLRAVAAVCDALAHAHARGVVHRDIKPGNVLVRDDGVLKLTDFGIALVSDPDATVDDRLLGTLSYMAPEQALGRDVDGAADIFSAALMLYEALAGANPFRARTPRELAERHAATALTLSAERPDLPSVVLRHIDRALLRDPRRRPTAAELRDALLHGARAIERGMVEDEPEPALIGEQTGPGLAARAAGAARRAIPSRRPRLHLVTSTSGPGTAERIGAALPRAAARGRGRVAPAALAGISATLGLGALPFYPTVSIPVLALTVAAVSLWRPLAGLIATALLILPLAGNLALGLVPVVAGAAAIWVIAVARSPGRGFLPALAPVFALAALWPVYLVTCASAPRAHIRFVTGAAGPLAIALVCGLAGIVSPLAGSVPAQGLAGRLAGSESIAQVADDLVAAVGTGVVVQSLGWGLLALAGLPLTRLTGARLRWFGAVWLGAGHATTVLGPALAGHAPAPQGLTAVAVLAAAILIGLRSVAPRPVDRTGAAPDATS